MSDPIYSAQRCVVCDHYPEQHRDGVGACGVLYSEQHAACPCDRYASALVLAAPSTSPRVKSISVDEFASMRASLAIAETALKDALAAVTRGLDAIERHKR